MGCYWTFLQHYRESQESGAGVMCADKPLLAVRTLDSQLYKYSPRKACPNLEAVILSRQWVCCKTGEVPEFHSPKAKSAGRELHSLSQHSLRHASARLVCRSPAVSVSDLAR